MRRVTKAELEREIVQRVGASPTGRSAFAVVAQPGRYPNWAVTTADDVIRLIVRDMQRDLALRET